MDGAERKVVWKDAAQPTSLVFSSSELGMISSAHINGSGYKELEAADGLTSVAFAEDTMFWITVSGVGTKPGSKTTISLSPPSSLPSPDTSPKTDPESSPDSVQLMNLEAQQCSQKRCSGNGHCVDSNGASGCVCSEGYSGDSCQEPISKSGLGPIIYAGCGCLCRTSDPCCCRCGGEKEGL
ncbi:hypothetical protein FQA47_002697 [Oryzias melastigma]|uniref:EGF-like domain-containing protein n=1 Tax=Oryzias melastigma TaxID=30732 RepID=A0A834BWV0_ORYME|nr:hypothetical protein FQA47_002697 [Oryzias melastigma]